MVATAKTFIHQLRNTMFKSSMHIVIICICLPAVFGMPYLGQSENFDKIYQNNFLDAPDSTDDIDNLLVDYQRPDHRPFQELGQLLAEEYDDDDSGNGFDVDSYDILDNSNDKVVGARAKRLGFSYFPFRYTRQFMLKQNKNALHDLLRPINAFQKGDYPPVKRRLAFTALRGR